MAKKPAPAEQIAIEQRDLARLRENPHNSRTHPPEQIRAMAAGIKEFGVPKISILVDERDVILAGHGVRLSMIEAGLKRTKVMVARGWPEVKKRAWLDADNRFAELGGFDEDKRRGELQYLKEQDFPLLAMGWERGLDEFISAGAPPETFPTFGEDLETERECPKCHYRFSGGKVPKDAPKKKNGK